MLPKSTTESNSGYPTRSLNRSLTSFRTLFNTAMTILVFVFAALTILPLLSVLYYVIVKGASSLNLSMFTKLPPPPMGGVGRVGGFGNALVGTLMMVGIAAAISIPFGMLAGVYLTEFSSPKVARWLRFATNVLSGVPSIIAGLFAYGVVVLTFTALKWGSFSAIAGGVALSILMLPIIVRTTDEALKLVPQELRQAALGLGATRFQTVWKVVLPAAIPAIVTGATLAIARAAGETAPLLFTALFSQFWPNNLLKPTPSLAVLVFKGATSPYPNWQQLAWAATLILVIMVLLTSIIARWATRQKVY